MTATMRTSISRFLFPKGRSNILLDLYTGVTRVKGGMIKITADNEFVGYRMFSGFCDGKTAQAVYFVMKLSKPSSNFAFWRDNVYSKTYQHEIAGDNIGMYFSYEKLNT